MISLPIPQCVLFSLYMHIHINMAGNNKNGKGYLLLLKEQFTYNLETTEFVCVVGVIVIH